MIAAVDTSVAIAAFAPWHEHHQPALDAARGAYMPAHCGIETYSTLTRLPEPFRAAGAVVAEYLRRRFENRWLFPSRTEMRDLPSKLARLAIVAGASYDALIALTVRDNDALLRTLDQRAQQTYRAMEVRFEFVG